MKKKLYSQVKVIEAFKANNINIEVLNLSVSTKTSKEAANAVGCNLSQIAKSIVFYEVDHNFHPSNLKDSSDFQDISLIRVTHPFGFFSNFRNLDKIKNQKTKVIFDCSHTYGLKIEEKNINNFCDIAFMSIQGNKAISSGEEG